MPVLITIASVTALLAGNSSPRGQNRASILDPASLRQRLKRLPEGETRARALAIADDLERLAVVALEFPVFTDGRAFSSARLLRERHGYDGEVRAVGNVLRSFACWMKSFARGRPCWTL